MGKTAANVGIWLDDKQVVPVILTIDGSECGPNHVFTRTWLPVTAQSPILLRTNLHNGILFRMSAFSIMSLISPLSKQEKLAQMQFDLQQLLTIRGEIIALLNKRLKECELPPDDAIAAVFSFIWYDVSIRPEERPLSHPASISLPLFKLLGCQVLTVHSLFLEIGRKFTITREVLERWSDCEEDSKR